MIESTAASQAESNPPSVPWPKRIARERQHHRLEQQVAMRDAIKRALNLCEKLDTVPSIRARLGNALEECCSILDEALELVLDDEFLGVA